MIATLFAVALTILAVFLILLVLVQRGRGGGLTGALGGMGGSSAFGAKAGDVFTRITIVTAAIWIAVCGASVYWAKHRGDRLGAASSGSATSIAAPDTQPAATAMDSATEIPADAATADAATSDAPADSGPAAE